MLSAKLKEAAGNGLASTLYVDDVFSTWLYTGNGSTQTITNGIDLAGQGGLVWLKSRSGAYYHNLFDTNRGINNRIVSNTSSGADLSPDQLTAFNSNGFTLGASSNQNISPDTYASWTFRKAAKFFDVVTYTGTGANRTIAHNLGIAPGMVIVKRTDTTGNWQVYSNGLTSAAYSIQLNLTNAQASATTVWNSTAPTSSVFSVGTDATVNASGGTYVAYLFAHNTASDGIIQCGSFTADASGNATVNLGWEPQYIMAKTSNNTSGWYIFDVMRGMSVTTSSFLYANSSGAEFTDYSPFIPTATGFTFSGASASFIYMAIRRPNKPPTSGTQVFSPVKQAGGGTVTTGFPVDLSINTKPSSAFDRYTVDRLRGVSKTTFLYLITDTAGAEVAGSGYGFGFDNNTGYLDNGVYGSGETPIYWNFRRAPGFFDVVCYTGTGSATTQAHNLTVVPELMIVKCRSDVPAWVVYNTFNGAGNYMRLNTTDASSAAPTMWNSTAPTSSVFSIGTAGGVNTSSATYVAYLFATLAGISKVGSYTGNGATQTINCGFTGGARFVLIKRTDSTGDWYVFDTARGMTTLTDPYLLLNSTAAEVATLGAVTSVTTGFAVNAAIVAAINTNAASYIYLSIA